MWSKSWSGKSLFFARLFPIIDKRVLAVSLSFWMASLKISLSLALAGIAAGLVLLIKKSKRKQKTAPPSPAILCAPVLATDVGYKSDVYGNSTFEVELMHYQVQDYFTLGFELKPGMTVFDVGANIGLFTLELMKRTNNLATVFCFEPIPSTCSILRHNVSHFSGVHVFNCGLGKKASHCLFSHNASAPAMSSCRTSEIALPADFLYKMIESDRLPKIYYKLFLFDPRILPSSMLKNFCEGLSKSWKITPIECEIRTMEEIIVSREVEKIDLLKIDVEGSELDVLEGISDKSWKKIRALAIEVHDIDNRVNKIKDLLKGHGFTSVIVHQEKEFQLTNIYSIFAAVYNLV